jgi:hypothetical protein
MRWIIVTALLLVAAAPQQPRDRERLDAAPQPEQERGKEYVVQLKLLEIGPDRHTHVLSRPQVCLLENQLACVEINPNHQELPSEIADIGDKLKIGLLVLLKVKSLDAETALLQLDVQHQAVRKARKQDTQIVGNTLRAVKEVELGEPVKFVMSSDRKGRAQRWVEATVKQGPLSPVREQGVVARPATRAQTVPPPIDQAK